MLHKSDLFDMACLGTLIQQEGIVPHFYLDSRGVPTGGIGRNLRSVGFRDDEILLMYDNDFTDALIGVRQIFKDLDIYPMGVKVALISLRFQLGQAGFLKFQKFIGAIKSQDWTSAAKHLKNSKLYQQTPKRVEQNARFILSGEIDEYNIPSRFFDLL